MTKKAIVAGHVVVDITPAFQNPPISRYDELFRPGTLVTVGDAHIQGGGCVSNTGLAMHFFGSDVLLVGRIGDDALGQMLQVQYRTSGVATHFVVDAQAPTGYTVVLSPVGLERMYLHNAGANDHFCNADLDEALWEGVDLFHFGYPPLLKRYYERGAEELLTLFRDVHARGVVTSLDMVMFDRVAEPAQQDWRAVLHALMPSLDLFAPSAEELLLMMEPEKYERLRTEAGTRDLLDVIAEEDIFALADELLAAGVRVLLIKCGTRGLYLFTAHRPALDPLCEKLSLTGEWADRVLVQPSFVAEHVAATTGAGDTSIAAFLTALLQGATPERALGLAAGAGACCVTGYDSLSGLQPFDVMEERIGNGWATHPTLKRNRGQNHETRMSPERRTF